MINGVLQFFNQIASSALAIFGTHYIQAANSSDINADEQYNLQ